MKENTEHSTTCVNVSVMVALEFTFFRYSASFYSSVSITNLQQNVKNKDFINFTLPLMQEFPGYYVAVDVQDVLKRSIYNLRFFKKQLSADTHRTE